MSYLFEILPSLLSGASMTLQVFALVLIFSIPLGVLIAFALQVHWKPLHHLINIYIWIMRGTPCLLYTSPSPRDPKTSRMPSSA